MTATSYRSISQRLVVNGIWCKRLPANWKQGFCCPDCGVQLNTYKELVLHLSPPAADLELGDVCFQIDELEVSVVAHAIFVRRHSGHLDCEQT